MPMHPDDLTYSLERARCPEADALLAGIAEAVAALAAVPRTGRGWSAAYTRLENQRDALRERAATVVTERGWFRRVPSDGYDGSYIGHEDR